MSTDYESLKYFNKVAETLSFVRSASELNIQKSLLSRKIAELENQLGVRLFHRTTRRVSLSEEGQIFWQEVRVGVRVFEEAVEALQSSRSVPQGTVRISTPVELGQLLIERVMPGFSEAYPLVKIDWDFSGEKRDLFQHRLDLVIRAGVPTEDSLVINKLGAVSFQAFVSPDLKLPKFKQYGKAELEQLPWVIFQPGSDSGGRGILNVSWDGVDFSFTPKITAPFKANSLTAVKTFVKQGHGVGFLPKTIFENELKEGTIVPLAPILKQTNQAELFLLYPSKRFIPPKTRALSQWIISNTKKFFD